MGHPNGEMDYVWTLSKGAMTLFPNAGFGKHIDPGQSYWGPDFPGVIWSPPAPLFLDRRDLHLADGMATEIAISSGSIRTTTTKYLFG
jgi:hypothetical protein